jgi:hypothetical protein
MLKQCETRKSERKEPLGNQGIIKAVSKLEVW